MKFLCLGYYDEKKFKAMPKAELDAIVSHCKEHDEQLYATGKMRIVASLATPQVAKSIRPNQGKAIFTDGPYAEAKEQLGSFFIIEAENLEEASKIAAMHPAALWGAELGWGVEVRPIEFFKEWEK